jgi:transposase
MRYELTDGEWATITPMLPNKARGVPRVDDRRVLNGIFWVSGAPWRDLPTVFGPYNTCYNRFVRWRRAGVWSRIMDALAATHDAAVQMIETSIVRVHQHGASLFRNNRQSMGRSRGRLTSKIHAVVDSNGLPVRLALTAGEAHDNRLAAKLLSRLKSGAMLWLIVDMTPTGLEQWSATVAHGRTSHHDGIERTRSASVRICTELATWSSGSSTKSSSVGVWLRATTNSLPTTSCSSSLRRSAYGCALMSPRPSKPARCTSERLGLPISTISSGSPRHREPAVAHLGRPQKDPAVESIWNKARVEILPRRQEILGG